MIHRFALVSAIALVAACSPSGTASVQSNDVASGDDASPNDPTEHDPEGEGPTDAGRDSGRTDHDAGATDGGAETSGCVAAPSGWRAMADMPELAVDLKGRRVSATAWTGSRFDVLRAWPTDCGAPSGCTFHAQAASFDPVANAWEVLPPPPDDAWFMSSVDTDGRWILHAGFDVRGYVFDPTSKSWSSISPAPLGPRTKYFAAYATTTQELIVYGGVHETETGPTHYHDGAAYSFVTRSWRKIAPSPLPEGAAGMTTWTGARMDVVIPNFVESGYSPIAAAAAYDPVTDTWSSLPLPTVKLRVIDAYTDLARNPAFFGGYRFVDDGVFPAERDGAWLDTATNTWSAIPDPGAALMTGLSRDSMTMFAANDRYYVWGGYELTSVADENPVKHRANTGFFYDTATKTWSAMPTEGAPSPRAYAHSAWTGCDAIVFGGLGDVDDEWNGKLFRP